MLEEAQKVYLAAKQAGRATGKAAENALGAAGTKRGRDNTNLVGLLQSVAMVVRTLVRGARKLPYGLYGSTGARARPRAVRVDLGAE